MLEPAQQQPLGRGELRRQPRRQDGIRLVAWPERAIHRAVSARKVPGIEIVVSATLARCSRPRIRRDQPDDEFATMQGRKQGCECCKGDKKRHGACSSARGGYGWLLRR